MTIKALQLHGKPEDCHTAVLGFHATSNNGQWIEGARAVAQLRNVEQAQVNTSSPTEIAWQKGSLLAAFSKVFLASQKGIHIRQKGLYLVQTQVLQVATSSRMSIAIELTVNGISQGLKSIAALQQNTDGNYQSSLQLMQVLSLKAGDVIGVHCQQMNNAGQVRLPEQTANLLAIKLD